jgi:uncharacterized protein YbjT (DUF2867 family)
MTNLILGGTGKTGRRIVGRLQAAGQPVRRVSRTADDLVFDLDQLATWAPALDGVTGVYVMEPNLQASMDHKERIPAFVDKAVGAGAHRLVLLSAPAADDDNHPLHAAEQAVRGSGVDWTILRPHWFSQNFSEAFWRQGILDGTLALPTGDGRTPFVDVEDIAEVAASALTEDGHNGRVYELTGPRALSFGEAVDLIGKATARTIRHVDVDAEDFVLRQVANGVSPKVAHLLTGLLVAIRDGSGAALTDGVERALGRPPTSFEDFVARTASAGHWN